MLEMQLQYVCLDKDAIECCALDVTSYCYIMAVTALTVMLFKTAQHEQIITRSKLGVSAANCFTELVEAHRDTASARSTIFRCFSEFQIVVL